MGRKIVGFYQDDAGYWVADLECGHIQHVRHNPPWTNRPWTTTAQGREAAMGRVLVCKLCARVA